MLEQQNTITATGVLPNAVSSVRVTYPDLHGVQRGKDVPLQEFDHAADHGLAFCWAVMGTDLRHTPVVGGEAGYPDMVAVPDLRTLVQLPWEPNVAACLADLRRVDGTPEPTDPRGAVRRAVEGFEELGFAPIVGPELEFFLLEPDGVAPELRSFVAGVLEHAPALMAFLNPTVNAYRRILPDSLAPTHANWGFDNRTTFIRIPPERGHGTRVEIRVGDGAANPYLGTAAVLAAGLDGVRRSPEPPEP